MIHEFPIMNRIDTSKTQWLGIAKKDLDISQKAYLYLLNQSQIVQKFQLRKPSVSVGSDPTNDIQLKDPYVSHHHCIIEERDGIYFLKDQKSTNGTFLNNVLIKETALSAQSYIQLGKSLLQFRLSEDKNDKKLKTIFHDMISRNPYMQNLFQSLDRISASSSTVIIYGETGTGKELVAKAIHKMSTRKQNPFITINCSAIPRDLIESELFGHIEGAFTGADRARKGHFLAAHGGTLFLDEIGEMPLELQPKLLRALEQREIRPLGSEKIKKIDIRIIAATHRDLSRMVQKGLFRDDLFYRLNLIPIHLPALRERKDDIPLLVHHFLQEIQITAKALKQLVDRPWPGNIRELKNVLDRAKLAAQNSLITEREIISVFDRSHALPFSETVHDIERDMLFEFLEKNQWNRSATARALLMPRSTLIDKINRYQLVPSSHGSKDQKS